MKDQNGPFPQCLPWETEDPESRNNICCEGYYGEAVHGAPWEPALTIDEVSHLLDRMVMDIQHLELEVIRARYKLSLFLDPPYDQGLEDRALSLLAGTPLADENTLAIVEMRRDADISHFEELGWQVVKSKEYKTNKHIFLRRGQQ